jgi:hypothetical protein
VAGLDVEGDSVVVRLSLLERLGAFVASEPRTPVAAVETVRVSDDPWSELRGIRAPGTGWPGVIALGTRRYSGGRDFVAVYGRKQKAVVVECNRGRWGRFVVTHDQAEQLAATIRERISPASHVT